MSELPVNIKKRISMYKEIHSEGFVFYPIQVENYEEFMIARQALDFVQQSLPLELMCRPLLEAFYKMEFDARENGQPVVGLFASALIGIGLALRLVPNGSVEDMLGKFYLRVDTKDPSRLISVEFIMNGEEQMRITPIQYARFRQIIAEQNGVELVSDKANPELLQAEHDLAEENAPELNVSVERMVSAICAYCGVEEEEVYKWSILKLHNRLNVFRNLFDYILCGVGEFHGATWKGGNPTPHPWFEKVEKHSKALVPIEEFAGGAGVNAIRESETI